MTGRERARVLVIEPAGLLWGSEYALLDLVKHVDRARYEIVVALPGDSPLSAKLAAAGIRFVEGPIGMLHQRGRTARVAAALWLRKLIGLVKPDILHVNQAGLGRLVGFARLGLKLPMVVHVRLWEDATRLARNPPSVLSGDRYVAISRFISESIGKVGRFPGYVSVIHDPFDPSTLLDAGSAGERADLRSELSIPRDHRIVLLVGRICHEKGQDIFLDAASRVARHNVTYLLAGDPPPGDAASESFINALRTIASRAALAGRVRFLGARPDVARLMKAADVLVLASRNEPFGRVLLEALAMETPVIAPDRGGPVEIVGNGVRGFLFVSEDAGSLAACIAHALSTPADGRRNARNGLAWIQDVCSPEKHATEIQGLWDSSIASPP